MADNAEVDTPKTTLDGVSLDEITEIDLVDAQIDRLRGEFNRAIMPASVGPDDHRTATERAFLPEYTLVSDLLDSLFNEGLVGGLPTMTAADARQWAASMASDLASIRNVARPIGPTLERVRLAVQRALDDELERVQLGSGGWEPEIQAKIQQALGLETLIRSAEVAGEVRQLAGQAATDSIGHGYAQWADREERRADFLRFAAIGLVLVGFAVATTFAIHEQRFSWTTQLAKSATALPLILVGAYLSSESRDHRRVGQRARAWQVLLTALRPFVADLDGADRRTVMMATAQALFKEPALVDGGAAIGDITGTLLAQLTELVKAAKPVE